MHSPLKYLKRFPKKRISKKYVHENLNFITDCYKIRDLF